MTRPKTSKRMLTSIKNGIGIIKIPNSTIEFSSSMNPIICAIVLLLEAIKKRPWKNSMKEKIINVVVPASVVMPIFPKTK